jgi:hypothetical protein
MGRTWFVALALLATGVDAAPATGMATCACLGALPSEIADIDCTNPWAYKATANSTLKCVYVPGADVPGMYPANYGEACTKQTEPGAKSCFNQNMTPPVEMAQGVRAGWCDDAWCYVDVCACDDPDATQSFYFPDVSLFYSYSTCGATDAYTSGVKNVVPGNEEKCGAVAEEASGAFQVVIMPATILLVLAMLQ